jgi:hypothetical protein
LQADAIEESANLPAPEGLAGATTNELKVA